MFTHSGNSAKQWEVINTIVNKSDKKEITRISLEGGRVVDSQETIANLFNEYFVSAPLQLVRASPDPDPATLARCYHQQRSMFLTPNHRVFKPGYRGNNKQEEMNCAMRGLNTCYRDSSNRTTEFSSRDIEATANRKR
ncbi:hypothetical protein J6590_027689 [Homalodisca vitripennis]|nr:hypothetical protein J6590_027689 [Homalodisca vitripennis]